MLFRMSCSQVINKMLQFFANELLISLEFYIHVIQASFLVTVKCAHFADLFSYTHFVYEIDVDTVKTLHRRSAKCFK